MEASDGILLVGIEKFLVVVRLLDFVRYQVQVILVKFAVKVLVLVFVEHKVHRAALKVVWHLPEVSDVPLLHVVELPGVRLRRVVLEVGLFAVGS